MSETATQTTTGVHGAPGPQATHAETSAEGHQGGLPQLNPHDFAPQLVWLALAFGALYWIMSRIALPNIANAIEKRRDQIASDIDTAKRLQVQAEQAEVDYETALAEAKGKAHGIAQSTKESLNAKTETKRLEVESQIERKLAEAEARILAAKQAAMNEVNEIASTTTREIVERLIGGDISDEEIAGAIQSAVKH